MGKGLDTAKKRKLKIDNKHTKRPINKKKTWIFFQQKIYNEVFLKHHKDFLVKI